MNADERAGAFSIQIKISDVKFFAGAFQFFFVSRIKRTGQPVNRVVGDFQRVIEIFRFDNG